MENISIVYEKYKARLKLIQNIEKHEERNENIN